MDLHSENLLDFRGMAPEHTRLRFIHDCMALVEGEGVLCLFDDDPSDLLREVERLNASRHFRRIGRGRWFIQH